MARAATVASYCTRRLTHVRTDVAPIYCHPVCVRITARTHARTYRAWSVWDFGRAVARVASNRWVVERLVPRSRPVATSRTAPGRPVPLSSPRTMWSGAQVISAEEGGGGRSREGSCRFTSRSRLLVVHPCRRRCGDRHRAARGCYGMLCSR